MSQLSHPRTARTALAALAVVAGASTLLATTPATAAGAATRLTVTASDTTVSPGEQVVLTGRLTRSGHGLRGDVQVYGHNAAGWYELQGAEVRTTSSGGYRVRVVLSRSGARELRVVGDPDAAGLGNARARITIQVG